MFKSIRKRDGKVVSFKQEKITEAIAKPVQQQENSVMIVQFISRIR